MVPIVIPSEIATVLNSIGVPPAARTPSLIGLARSRRWKLHGIASVQVLATPIVGLAERVVVEADALHVGARGGAVGAVEDGGRAGPRGLDGFVAMGAGQCRVRTRPPTKGGRVLSRVRSKLTYANVMATIAVFLALGGGIAWALANDSVKSKHIKDGQVKPQDLSDSVEPQGFSYYGLYRRRDAGGGHRHAGLPPRSRLRQRQRQALPGARSSSSRRMDGFRALGSSTSATRPGIPASRLGLGGHGGRHVFDGGERDGAGRRGAWSSASAVWYVGQHRGGDSSTCT